MQVDNKEMNVRQWVLAFEEITDELLLLLTGLSEPALNQVPFAGSWTAGQLSDHLLKSYQVAEVLTGNTTFTRGKPNAQLPGLSKVFLDFEIKMEAPDFIVPTHKFIHKTTLLESLRKTITEILQLVNQHDFNMEATYLDFALPEVGHSPDGSGWDL